MEATPCQGRMWLAFPPPCSAQNSFGTFSPPTRGCGNTTPCIGSNPSALGSSAATWTPLPSWPTTTIFPWRTCPSPRLGIPMCAWRCPPCSWTIPTTPACVGWCGSFSSRPASSGGKRWSPESSTTPWNRCSPSARPSSTSKRSTPTPSPSTCCPRSWGCRKRTSPCFTLGRRNYPKPCNPCRPRSSASRAAPSPGRSGTTCCASSKAATLSPKARKPSYPCCAKRCNRG